MRSRALALSASAITFALGVASCEQILGIQPVPVPDGAIFDAVSTETSTSDAGDAAPSNCGAFGQPCCDGGCSSGQCLETADASRCVAFAGTFETNANSCNTPVCPYPNVFSSACQCPPGWPSTTSGIDVGCNDASAPTHLSGAVQFCAAATMPPGSDWAGAYVNADIPGCVPGSDAGCMMANPYTGTCSCPVDDGGMEAFGARVFVPGTLVDGGCANGFLGGLMTICMPQSAKPTTIYGVYETDVLGGCKHSSRLNGCSCPAGTIAQVRTIEEYPAQCTSSCSFPQATITFCMAP